MAKDLNVFTCTGRLGKDAEVKSYGNGKEMLMFSLASNDYDFSKKEEVTNWFNVISFTSVDFLKTVLSKGTQVSVSGTLRLEKFTGNDGVERTTVKLIANSIVPIGATSDSSFGKSEQKSTKSSYSNNDVFEISDDDLPF